MARYLFGAGLGMPSGFHRHGKSTKAAWAPCVTSHNRRQQSGWLGVGGGVVVAGTGHC